jgi:glycogen synthase
MKSPERPGTRVLFWSELFWPYIGGNEAVSARLVPALRDKGYDFTVVTSHQSLELPDREDYRGIPVHRFPFRAALASRCIETITALRREMASFVGRMAPELIHVSCVGPSSYFLPLLSPYVAAVPLLAHLHNEVLPSQARADASILRRVLERADWVASVSAAVHAQVTDVFPSIRSRSSVITNAIEEPQQSPAKLPFDPPCVLCLGRLVPDKGFDVALRVFARVGVNIPDVRFIMAGDGPERSRLEQEARALHLGDRIEFLGSVHPGDVPSVIDRATLVLMPSRREGLPLVAIEAAYMGRPTVATQVSGLPEVVVNGETGLLAPRDDVEALSQAVLTLLTHPDVARRMGSVARCRARDVFDLERCVERFDELYRSIVPSRPEPWPTEVRA